MPEANLSQTSLPELLKQMLLIQYWALTNAMKEEMP